MELVLDAVRGLRGRATVGDVVAATGLARDDAEQGLRELLGKLRGHVAVGDAGDIVYEFDPRLMRRDTDPFWKGLRRGAAAFFRRAFKVWIVAMLVVYFIVFVALVVAALVAILSRGGDRRGGGRGRVRVPTFWLWYLFWTPRWRYGRPYYGQRWERAHRDTDPVPFYKKVFAFVFGPDEPRPTQEQLDRSTIRLIRARAGVLATAELIEHTGLPVTRAEEEMGRLMGAYAGDVRVSHGGELLYTFPELMVSASGRTSVRAPEPAWRRLEYPRALTGNAAKADALIGGLNGFNLVAALTAPWFIFPQLGIGGSAAQVALVLVPALFSTLFFAVPLARRLRIRRENAARRTRNLRKVLLAHVFEESLTRGVVTESSAVEWVRRTLAPDTDAEPVRRELQRMVAELDAEVAPDDSGSITYRFPTVLAQFVAARDLRRSLRLEEREVGRIVYSSADSPEQLARRELEDFDAALAPLRDPQRVAYEADYEVIEFDEALARQKSPVGR
jgi:hypothetical protein